MNNNIFLKNKKYNPDIDKNFNKMLEDREIINNTTRDNSISNIDFTNINVTTHPKIKDDEITKLIKSRELERRKEEKDFKEYKNTIPTSNPNDFKDFTNLKNNHNEYNSSNKDSDNFKSIVEDLKKLGIFNN